MAGKGGKIAPDGRAPVAPGVGKNARRHDLEAPATPGLHDSDLQQGDVQRLEQAQKVAPTVKRSQPAASPQAPARRRRGVQRGSGEFSMAAPDPVEMAGGRLGGNIPVSGSSDKVVDPSAWFPLAQRMASTPNAGGSIAAQVANQLTQYRRRPVVSQAIFVDLDEMDKIIGES